MITEQDITRADADQLSTQYANYLDPEAWTDDNEADEAEYQYWAEVQECCRGTDWTCGHYGYYSALDDRFTHYED